MTGTTHDPAVTFGVLATAAGVAIAIADRTEPMPGSPAAIEQAADGHLAGHHAIHGATDTWRMARLALATACDATLTFAAVAVSSPRPDGALPAAHVALDALGRCYWLTEPGIGHRDRRLRGAVARLHDVQTSGHGQYLQGVCLAAIANLCRAEGWSLNAKRATIAGIAYPTSTQLTAATVADGAPHPWASMRSWATLTQHRWWAPHLELTIYDADRVDDPDERAAWRHWLAQVLTTSLDGVAGRYGTSVMV